MMAGLVMGMSKAIARTAIGRTGIRDVLLALGILLGLSGCAASHGRAEPERDAGVSIGSSDAGSLADSGERIDAGSWHSTPFIDVDGDGYGAHVDCNDHDATIHPDAIENACAFDGIDQNCDGWDVSALCDPDPECAMWLCNG